MHENEAVILMIVQPTGVLQYLQYKTPHPAVTWHYLALWFITPALMDSLHQYLTCRLFAMASTGHQTNCLVVKVI